MAIGKRAVGASIFEPPSRQIAAPRTKPGVSQSDSTATNQTPPPRLGTPSPPQGLPVAVLVFLYLLIGSLPLLLAQEQVGGFWRKLASGMAMVAFALLAVQFVLSGRLAAITGRIKIDALMQFHRTAAKVITVALLVHPVLYVVPVASHDPIAALDQLVQMFTNGAFASGVLAWVLLLGLTVIAMLRTWLPVPYEAWRISHGFAACALAATGLHHTVNVGSYSDDIMLAQLWIVMVALTFAIVGYLYFVKPWHVAQRPYYVSHVLRLGEGLWGVTLWPAKLQPVGLFARGLKPKVTQAMAFEAGQFAWVTIGISPFVLSDHPLSIASAPGDRPRFKFVVKEVGDFSKSLGRIPVGTQAYIDGPYGHFTLSAAEAASPKAKHAAGLAFIAGGIGIAPILSLLRDRQAAGEKRPMRLIYGNRSAAQIVYREELTAMESAMDFRVHHVVGEPPYEWSGGVGVIDDTAVDEWLDWPDPGAWIYFVCGPKAMMDAVERALIARGVPATHIVTERFRYD